MRKLLILGGGTAGTMMANKLHKELDKSEWEISIVDKHKIHCYHVIYSDTELIKADENQVILEGGRVLHYDYLIIATGAQTRPDETPVRMKRPA